MFLSLLQLFQQCYCNGMTIWKGCGKEIAWNNFGITDKKGNHTGQLDFRNWLSDDRTTVSDLINLKTVEVTGTKPKFMVSSQICQCNKGIAKTGYEKHWWKIYRIGHKGTTEI